MCAQIPAVLGRIARLSWRTDRRAVQLLLGCQVITGVAAAVLLAATARAMAPVLGDGTAGERLRGALPALMVVALAAALARAAGAVATYAERRITPRLTTETDTALVEAVCRVEASAYAEDGFSDRREAAEMGVIRTQVMVTDAQRFLSALIRMVTAGGVLSVLNPWMLPPLLLAVPPAGVGAVLTARVDYEIHDANIADRNARGMMRWWATESKYGDEVRANSMTDHLIYWYRALSDRCDRRTLAAAPRTLRISLLSALAGGVFLVATWGALAWLAVSGRIELAVAATAVIAVLTTLAALSQVVINGAAVFHTSLYLSDMQAFLDDAAARAPKPGSRAHAAPTEEIQLDEVVYQYPGKDKPAVDGVSLTLRRGQILAIVGANGSGNPHSPGCSPGSTCRTRARSRGTAPTSPRWTPPPSGPTPAWCRRSSRSGRCESAKTSAVGRRRKRTERGGYVYLHSAIDGFSRLAYTEALPDEKAVTAVAFLHRARAWFAAHGINGSRPICLATTARSNATTGSSPRSSSTLTPGPPRTSDAEPSPSGTSTTTTTGPTAEQPASRRPLDYARASPTSWPRTPNPLSWMEAQQQSYWL
ncbi:hypothetical protein SUDANB174_06938 [Streptomyces sp. enrichment culture]